MNRGSAAAAAADCDSSASDCERDAAEEARIDELMRRRGWSRVPTKKQREAQCFKTRAFLTLCCIACVATTCACVTIAMHDPTPDAVDAGTSMRANSSEMGLNTTSKPQDGLPKGKARRHLRRRHGRRVHKQHSPDDEE